MAEVLRISEATALGLHALVLVAQATEPLASDTIAQELRGSRAHLSKVLKVLTDAGLLDSRRGPRGGYSLARPAAQISLAQAYEALEGPIRRGPCVLATPVCGGRPCILGDLVERVRGEARQYLEETTLADAARRQRRS